MSVSNLQCSGSTTPDDTILEEEEEDEDMEMDIDEESRRIRVGVCAMNKKSHSRPMKEILSRVQNFDLLQIEVIPDDVIMNEPVENWPIVDCLISFFSRGFPLAKAVEYAKLRQPLLLNDLETQFSLMDRSKVFEILHAEGIETPDYAILRRTEDGVPIDHFVETDDAIEINGKVFHKPFVEKPLSAEDHNVYIYYPSSAGGGSQRLFRKVANRSSTYSQQTTVRRTGSYVYENFMPTDGTDVKVYTVGPEYAHAEARKSPALDGKVDRDSQGKEIRYPVILTAYEKEIAHKVCLAFKQTVCGFDLLRANGKSYVCDVNGFSFVKTSKKYYDDCGQVLGHMIMQELSPQLCLPYQLESEEMPEMFENMGDGNMLELRCVVAIIRHGDRTPKQKMKMEVRNPQYLQLFRKYGGTENGKLKLKRPKQLQEVLDVARELLQKIQEGEQIFEKAHKLQQLRSVLEMYGHFSGINRKVQMKYLGRSRESSEGSGNDEETHGRLGYESDINYDSEKEDLLNSRETSLLLILKWGGELTKTGREQAEEIGRAFRCMYPGGEGEYASFPGCGLLRLHSTYRHDLKIYASDEGRVQMTAAAFAKGLLALEGELTPILVHLVRSDKDTTDMLDTATHASRIMTNIKGKIHDILKKDKEFTETDYEALAPTGSGSLLKAMQIVKNPYRMCQKVDNLVHSLIEQLRTVILDPNNDPREPCLYHGETLSLMMHRWTKLEKDFKLQNNKFDISLIPDIYDCIKYDVQHNSNIGLKDTHELYRCAKALADIVIPQEYGVTPEEKLNISQRVCNRLLKKIQVDLKHADQLETECVTRLNPNYLGEEMVYTPHRHVRTRVYITSESHVHTFLSALRYGNLFKDYPVSDEQWNCALSYLGDISELNYMTQIVLMLYEDPSAGVEEEKYHLELHFSPGAKTMDDSYIIPTHPTQNNVSSEVIGLRASGQTSQTRQRCTSETLPIVEKSPTVSEKGRSSSDGAYETFHEEMVTIRSPGVNTSISHHPHSLPDISSAAGADDDQNPTIICTDSIPVPGNNYHTMSLPDISQHSPEDEDEVGLIMHTASSDTTATTVHSNRPNSYPEITYMSNKESIPRHHHNSRSLDSEFPTRVVTSSEQTRCSTGFHDQGTQVEMVSELIEEHLVEKRRHSDTSLVSTAEAIKQRYAPTTAAHHDSKSADKPRIIHSSPTVIKGMGMARYRVPIKMVTRTTKRISMSKPLAGITLVGRSYHARIPKPKTSSASINWPSDYIAGEYKAVAPIHPLQTLHNDIQLKQMDLFLDRLTQEHVPIPIPASPAIRKPPPKKAPKTVTFQRRNDSMDVTLLSSNLEFQNWHSDVQGS